MAVTLYRQVGKGKARRYQKVNLGRGRRPRLGAHPCTRLSPREIPHRIDLAGRTAPQHHRNCTGPRPLRSERKDQTVPCPLADA